MFAIKAENMKNTYDILIAGGGPAGLTASLRIRELQPDCSVILIEKSNHYSDSVKCGEGVWKVPFEKLITPKAHWIRQNITKASFLAPNHTEVLFSDKGKTLGYILDRITMQEDIIAELVQTMEVKRGVSVRSVIPGTEFQAVTLSSGEKIEVKVVIDASGPSSHLGEPNGIPHVNTDVEPALYAIVKGAPQKTDTLVLQMSKLFSPGGYVWLFPVDETTVNVGIVFGKGEHRTKSIRHSLEMYIENYIPGGIVESWHGGAIPSFAESKPMAVAGFIQCGDAGSLVNPITRSGISESMNSGKLAAETACSMLEPKANSKKLAKAYEKKLFAEYGKKMEKVAKVKHALYSITDEEYNRSADKLSEIPEEKRTMLKILKVTMANSPKLLLAMRHLL